MEKGYRWRNSRSYKSMSKGMNKGKKENNPVVFSQKVLYNKIMGFCG